MVRKFRPISVIGILLLVSLAVGIVACSSDDGEDRPGSVQVISESGSVSASASGSASGSMSASGIGSASGSVSGASSSSGGVHANIGAYAPASDVSGHALVCLDVAEINGQLGEKPIDWSAVKDLYENGKLAAKSDGSMRTLAGVARKASRSEPLWDDYTSFYGDQTWMDSFVSAAVDGTGAFSGESDGVRKQGAQKGMMNQVMIAWSIHELVAAMAKANDGNFDADKGAPHNWDEFWAFYHGDNPGACPFATADKRGKNFGTGTSANDAILKATNEGRDALLAKDAGSAQKAMDEIIRQIRITYTQASIRYASKITGDLAKDDAEKARVHQAEGWSFFRIIEPWVAATDAAAAKTIAGHYDLANQPSANAGPDVLAALESVYPAWGISSNEIGTLQ